MKLQLQKLTANDGPPTEVPGEVRSCRFNSGLFNVPWNESSKLLEETGLEVMVVRPPGEKL
jgi:ADP-ribose 1''-phosphate phosphatase